MRPERPRTNSFAARLKRRVFGFEVIEQRLLLAADPVITEFMASNSETLNDGHGESSDWIELYNKGDAAVDLQGWYLTDDSRDLTKWAFPRVNVEAGQFLIVFASGRDEIDDAGNLHANFKISRSGEYLALVRPDASVATQLRSFPEQFTDISYGLPMDANGEPLGTAFGFFDAPTPGVLNPPSFSVGPRIGAVHHSPPLPVPADPLLVTTEVRETLHPVASVSLVYRVMFEEEVTLSMTDDGQQGDVISGDGIFTGTIPGDVATAGEMLRYYVVARDLVDTSMRAPRVVDTSGDDQSAFYFGTVIEDESLPGELPIFHWFTENVANAHRRSGARAAVFYDGEFYDNVFVRQRGAFTNAASQKFEFNDVQPFRATESLGRVPEINLNAEGDDSAFVRQTLALESYQAGGAPAPGSFLMQLRVNGRLDRVGIFIEQIDETFLRRQGLDPQGALYKFVQRQNNISSAPALADMLTGVEKKLGPLEDFSDLQRLIDHLNLATAGEREAFIFDNLNLPQIINYLAVRTVVAEADDTAKNFYLYRNSHGDAEWSIFPWDKDRTFGKPEEPVTNRQFMTHPFLGAAGNRLYRAVFEDPTTREMYLRRLRTVMDQLLQPPTADRDQWTYEQRVDQLYASAERLLPDRVGSEVTSLKDFFPPHRENLYLTHSIDRVTDLDAIMTIVPEFVDAVRYFVPVDDSLGTMWTRFDPPANIDHWSLGTAGIGFEREPENFRDLIRTSVNPADSCVTCTSVLLRIPFSIDDPAQINELTLRMKYDDGFVAYLNGVEVARRNVEGEPLFNTRSKGRNDNDAVVFENIVISEHLEALRPGGNILAIHAINISPTNSDMLLSPELVSGTFGDDNAAGIPHAQVGHPAIRFGTFEHDPASGNRDESFIELTNPNDTAVDISGWRLTGAVQHTFQPGTVIPANGTMFVSPHVTAFRHRNLAPTGGMGLFVQGDYEGDLSSESVVQLVGSDGTLVDVLQTSGGVTGDLNQDGQVDIADVEQLCAAVRSGDTRFDLNGDKLVDQDDLKLLVQTIVGTGLGDSNLDGVFDSRDFVQVFQAGEYEDRLAGNSTWSEGDWNCDGDFDSKDLVAAFQAGRFVALAEHPALSFALPERPRISGSAAGSGVIRRV